MTNVSEQDASQMPTHQIRFDDGIFFLLSFITTIFSHGSQLDAHQLLNILLPFSKNPEKEEGRICMIQPVKQHTSYMFKLLKFVFAMSKRINKVMRDIATETYHMDLCQGKAFHEVICKNNTQNI